MPGICACKFNTRKDSSQLTKDVTDCDIDIGVSSCRSPQDRCILTDHKDTHEGAEGPLVGVIAAFGGLMASIGTDTTDFVHRLKKQPHNEDMEVLARTVTNGPDEAFDRKKGITSKHLKHLAYRMAKKTYEDDPEKNFSKPETSSGIVAIRRKVEEKKARGGRGYQVTSAVTHFVGDLAATLAKGKFPF